MNKNILNALIGLSSDSMTAIAKQADIDQGNLSAWLKDQRTLSYEAQIRLESALGIDNDVLMTDRVFFWQTDRNFDLLQLVLNEIFPDSKILPVVKARAKHYDLSDLFAQPMSVFTNERGHRAVVMLKTPIIKDLQYGSSLPWLSPDFLQGTTWLNPVDANSKQPFPTPLQLDKSMYIRWKKGNITINEFNQLLLSEQAVTWNTVADEAQRLGVTAEQLLALLLKEFS